MIPLTLYTAGVDPNLFSPAAQAYVVVEKGRMVTSKAETDLIAGEVAANYRALINGLLMCLKLDYTRVGVYVGNNLIFHHLSRRRKVRSPHLKALHRSASALLLRFDSYTISRETGSRNPAKGFAEEVQDSFRRET